MPTAPKTKTTAAADALKRRQEGRKTTPVDITEEALAIAGKLRERDHLEGCPVSGEDELAHRVEAYAVTATAPTMALQDQGIAPGDTVLVVRCASCGGMRYFADHASVRNPVEAVTGFVDAALRTRDAEQRARNGEPTTDEGDLDGSL